MGFSAKNNWWIPTQRASNVENVAMSWRHVERGAIRFHPCTTLWHHNMDPFSELLALCGRNPPFTAGLPLTKGLYCIALILFLCYWPVNKQSIGQWFQMPWHSCDSILMIFLSITIEIRYILALIYAPQMLFYAFLWRQDGLEIRVAVSPRDPHLLCTIRV